MTALQWFPDDRDLTPGLPLGEWKVVRGVRRFVPDTSVLIPWGWTLEELREAHAAYKAGTRTNRARTGHRHYAALMARQRRGRERAARFPRHYKRRLAGGPNDPAA